MEWWNTGMLVYEETILILYGIILENNMNPYFISLELNIPFFQYSSIPNWAKPFT
jgi:hypothetical protein